MKLLIKLSVGALIVILLYEIGLNLLNKYYTTPTRGEKIAAYEKTNSALLVIDIQEDLTGKNAKAPYPYKNSDDFIDKVNTVTNLAKKKGYLIIYIKQEFSNKLMAHFLSGGRLLKGKPGTRLDTRLKLRSENIFTKGKSDAFSNNDLEKLLFRNQINQLYIVGLDAEACVYNTARGALNRNYKVSVIEDAVITLDMKKMNSILETYRKNKILIINSSNL